MTIPVHLPVPELDHKAAINVNLAMNESKKKVVKVGNGHNY